MEYRLFLLISFWATLTLTVLNRSRYGQIAFFIMACCLGIIYLRLILKKKISKPPTIVIAPISVDSYLTEGKEYEVIRAELITDERGYRFKIKDDVGDFINCLENGCLHINGLDWIIKEREV